MQSTKQGWEWGEAKTDRQTETDKRQHTKERTIAVLLQNR